MLKKQPENAMLSQSGNETASTTGGTGTAPHGTAAKNFRKTDIFEATHVQVNGRVFAIVSKWGVGPEPGYLRRPSEGGFGVVVRDGGDREVTMWAISEYLVADDKGAE